MESDTLIILDPNWNQDELRQLDEVDNITVKDQFKTLNNTVQATSEPNKQIKDFKAQNQLVESFHLAYAWHIPLQLSPDHIWLTILQGFSRHVEKNAQKLQSKFVNFDGKQTLIVIRDSFVLGSPDNDWAGVFEEFSGSIKSFIGSDNHALLCSDNFSTTTPGTTAVYNLTLMDIMKSYFDYEVHTRCGIPKIKLLGTRKDWEKLIQKTGSLAAFDLEWWIPHLVDILTKFLEAFDGKFDLDFWKMAYKFHEGRGSGAYDSVEGWINNFFPYINDQKSSHILPLKEYQSRFQTLQLIESKQLNALTAGENGTRFRFQKGMNNVKIPPSYTKTPFIWQYLGKRIPMEFIGGIVGIEITSDGFALPTIQWAVANDLSTKQ